MPPERWLYLELFFPLTRAYQTKEASRSGVSWPLDQSLLRRVPTLLVQLGTTFSTR